MASFIRILRPLIFCPNRKKNIDEELAEIEPLVREAKEAVSNIKSEALTEIRYREFMVGHCMVYEFSE